MAHADNTSRAGRFYDREDLRVESVTQAPLGPDEYRIRVSYAGICGSDLHEYYHGPWNCQSAGGGQSTLPSEGLPQTLGHEFAGTIVEGPEGGDLVVGTRVTIEPVMGCRDCSKCLAGKPALCECGLAMYGYNKAGGLADFAVVKRINIHPLPSTMPLWVGALAEPFSVAWHASRQGDVQAGMTCFVAGCGPIGILLIRVLKAKGVRRIVASEPNKIRKAMALDSGADLVLDPGSQEEELPSETFDVSFDCAGLESTADACLHRTKRAGTMVMVGLWSRKAKLDMMAIVLKEIRMVGSCCFEGRDMDQVINAMHEGRLDVKGVVTAVIPLERVVEDGLRQLRDDSGNLKILVEIQAVAGETVGEWKAHSL